jgi:hypothetical protein
VAAIAASVGVKAPDTMPPISSTGVSSGRKARSKVYQTRRSAKLASRWKPRVCA